LKVITHLATGLAPAEASYGKSIKPWRSSPDLCVESRHFLG